MKVVREGRTSGSDARAAGDVPGEVSKRRYTMRARAAATEATRARVLDCAYELILQCSYEELTLLRVAERAGVTFQTVLRHFGSKDGLIAAVAETHGRAESDRRRVRAGDTRGAARVLVARYEETGDALLRWEQLEDRVAVIADGLRLARAGHAAWLEQTFADALARTHGRERQVLLAELYAATDINTWRLWRRHLGLTRREAETAMRHLLDALVGDQ
jgi:AcrR family transcriptional regulator